MRLSVALSSIVVGLAASGPALAVTSTRSVPSAFGGNGHNISFDGRLLLVRDSAGWQAQLVRPEAATFLGDGLPDATGPLLSPRAHVFGVAEGTENALAICETDPARAPYTCDAAGAADAAGAYDCYDVWIVSSDAVTPPAAGGFVLERRHLTLWVAAPRTADAQIDHWQWGDAEPLTPTIRGIEPTITADGKLLVFQGHPDNDGEIDVLMYTVAGEACAAGGWSAPKPISSMHTDAAVVGAYPLAERKLRAADGTPFEPGELFRGAYPWVTADGEAIIFAAAAMPCMAPEVPAGCGPRRNALSVVGYPTNWGIAHIDGGVNPDTNQTVRLFFSSPGPSTFSNLPVTDGVDVWPFFGSNTSNYVELSFDDGLDGNYAGFWHLNESIDHEGQLDEGRTPDVSGYFNTATLEGGLAFAKVNDGVVGKSLAFDGIDDRLVIEDAASLDPVNGITIDFWIQPQSVDCDGANNWRMILGKGDIASGAYSVVLEESLAMQARVNVEGEQVSLWSPPLSAGVWTHVSFEYDGPSGKAGWWFDEALVAEGDLAAGVIEATGDDLKIGGPGERAACPDGDGAFSGRLDEVAVSRFARRLGEPPMTSGVGGAGGAGGGAATGTGGSGAGGAPPELEAEPGPGADGGCGCSVPGGSRTSVPLAILGGLFLAWRRRRR